VIESPPGAPRGAPRTSFPFGGPKNRGSGRFCARRILCYSYCFYGRGKSRPPHEFMVKEQKGKNGGRCAGCRICADADRQSHRGGLLPRQDKPFVIRRRRRDIQRVAFPLTKRGKMEASEKKSPYYAGQTPPPKKKNRSPLQRKHPGIPRRIQHRAVLGARKKDLELVRHSPRFSMDVCRVAHQPTVWFFSSAGKGTASSSRTEICV